MIPSVSEVSKLSSLPINEAIEQPEVQNAIGKKHALKRYDQFTLILSQIPDRNVTELFKTIFVFPFIEDNKDQEKTYKGLVSLGNRLKMEHESWIKEMIKRKYRLERYEKLNIDLIL